MMLPPDDAEFLSRAGYTWRTFEEGGTLNVEVSNFPLPDGLSAKTVTVLFRLSPGYPDAPPDMWWVIPHLTTAGGGVIQATESLEIYDGRTWQRWSRHLDPSSWKAGVDGLESYIRLLRTELTAAAA